MLQFFCVKAKHASTDNTLAYENSSPVLTYETLTHVQEQQGRATCHDLRQVNIKIKILLYVKKNFSFMTRNGVFTD